LLHDALEDTSMSENIISENFWNDILEIVKAVFLVLLYRNGEECDTTTFHKVLLYGIVKRGR